MIDKIERRSGSSVCILVGQRAMAIGQSGEQGFKLHVPEACH